MEWVDTPGSSMINGFGYDTEREVLTVEFKKGARYEYTDVPYSVYEDIKQAESTGRFFLREIKDHYDYVKL